MSLSTKIERTKRAKLRKEMLVESKLEHCLVIGSYLELQISNLGLLYMDRRVRHRTTTFMWSLRFKDVVFKSKLQQQQRSPNLSCSPNTVQCLAHIWSSRCPNDLFLFSWKAESISYNFHVYQRTQFGWQHFCFIQTRR